MAVTEYIVLPPQGMRNPMMTAFLGTGLEAAGLTPIALSAQSVTGRTRRKKGQEIKVLDSVHEDGAKLVAMSEDAARTLRNETPGLRIVPVIYYEPAVRPLLTLAKASRPMARAAAAALRISVIDKASGKAVPRATVTAFTDFAQRIGATGRSTASGSVVLQLSPRARIEQLYVYGPNGYWGHFARDLTLKDGATIALRPIDLASPDLLRQLYSTTPPTAGTGVKVGVIDSGIALDHTDLTVGGGLCTVVGETPTEYGPSSDHGSHVAGIIAARGAPPIGVRGVAPNAVLHSYRVFGMNNPRASNYAIIKAIDQAVADGCDLINMSLGGGAEDQATDSAIREATEHGCLVIAAAGNDGRQPVSSPARYAGAVAISAMGERGSFPSDSTETADIMAPYGDPNTKRFIARFSNIGPEIDFTGPGVGIVSTVPGGYAVMSGTSMATPAITGVAAWLLSQRTDIMDMRRDRTRSAAISQLLLQHAVRQGFAGDFEGSGLPQ